MAQITLTEEYAIDLLKAYIKRLTMLNKLRGLNQNKIEKINEIQSRIDYLKGELAQHGYDYNVVKGIESDTNSIISSKVVQVYTDGAARGNNNPSEPNQSAIGFAVYLDGRLFHQEAKYIGSKVLTPLMKDQPESCRIEVEATNNTSEYLAIISALEYLIENGYTLKKVQILSDSNVMVQQINLTNASRAPHLIQLRNVARELMKEFEDIEITHVPRKENAYVDKLVNDVLDSQERR